MRKRNYLRIVAIGMVLLILMPMTPISISARIISTFNHSDNTKEDKIDEVAEPETKILSAIELEPEEPREEEPKKEY